MTEEQIERHLNCVKDDTPKQKNEGESILILVRRIQEHIDHCTYNNEWAEAYQAVESLKSLLYLCDQYLTY